MLTTGNKVDGEGSRSDSVNESISGLVVSMLATGPLGLAAAGSGTAEDGGFLWVIKNL
jgi:hypothetical protein